MMDLDIAAWAGWAPSLETPHAWRGWAHQDAPPCPAGDEVPALGEVPPMTRRRIERLARLAVQVAAWVQGSATGAPAVFASRHGDARRSVDLLTELARERPLSPTGFGLSVHNAIAGQYSIARKDTGNFSAVAAGTLTTEAAFTEAHGLLADGHDAVTVVVYDARLPAVYAPFVDEPQADFAWAVRLSRGPGTRVRLEPGAAPASYPSGLPHALEVFRLILGGGPPRLDHRGWRWSRP